MRYILVFILFIFTGCNNVQDKIQNSIQTDNAKHIKHNYKELVELLLEYKKKLDKRNPKGYSPQLNTLLKKSINTNSDDITLYVQNTHPLKNSVGRNPCP